MSKNFMQTLILIAFGVILFVGLMNLGYVVGFLAYVFKLILPVFAGLLLAFVLNVPVSGLEKLFERFFANKKRKPNDVTLTRISIVIILVAISAVIFLVVTLAGPEIVYSVKSIYYVVESRWPTWAATLKDYDIDISGISEWFKTTDFQNLIVKITSGTGVLLDTVIGAAASTISGVITASFSLIIAIYLLFSKKQLSQHTKLLMDAYCKPKPAEKVIYVSRLIQETYAKFLSGQCVEAVILGVLIFIAFTIFKLPYAALIAVITSISAFVPYIGAFSACAVGAVLTLIANPSKVLICIIVYNVVQFIENQFIYPHVVGSSVGLSALWTLLAALIGGKLLGLVGIIFFIPLTAVIRTLIAEETSKRLRKKRAVTTNNSNQT